MNHSTYINLPHGTSLVEALDTNNRPLCLMPARSILEQRLRHKSIWILLENKSGQKLLKSQPNGAFGFTASAILPAGMDGMDVCEGFFRHMEVPIKKIRLSGIHPPVPQNKFSLAYVYSALCPLYADEDILPVDRVEFNALHSRGYEIDEFLIHIAESGWLGWN